MAQALDLPRVPVSQPRLFLWLRLKLFGNGLWALIRRARLRLGMILGLSMLAWFGLYGLFAEGLQFLRDLRMPGTYVAIELIFGTFFLSLTALIIFSVGLLLYGSLFRAPEAGFLLATPANPDQIFAYKFQEAMVFSGWAFLLLGLPLLVAFGIEKSATWYYYVLLLPYLIGFLLLPGSIGALACLLIVHYLPHRRKQVLVVILIGLFAGLFAWVASVSSGAQVDSVSEAWLRKLIRHLQPSQLPFLPSRWMTRGLMAGAAGDWAEALFNLLLVWSNGLVLYVLTTWTARRLYRPAYNRVASTASRRRKYGTIWVDRLAYGLLVWSDPRTRLFMIKELRTFRRDPIQWAQVLIMGVILLLYFLNIPYLPHRHYDAPQRGFVSLLNLAVVGLMLATYTCRFVFPMMSLEGTKFWILGLLPLRRDQLLWSKFVYAATVTFATSGGLICISEAMLLTPWPLLALRMLTMLILSLGLSGTSVGLGAYLVNLKESNPSKIATGFGGTINLLVSLLFVVAIILLAGLQTMFFFLEWYGFVAIATAGMVVLGLLTLPVPMLLGIRAFRKMEF